MLRSRRALLPSFVFVLGLGLDLLADACSDGSTSGKRVVLATTVGPAAGTAAPFTNANGWEIRLDRALVSVGALHYFEGASLFSRYAPPAQLFGVRKAFAHPGHYQEGAALGQMLVPSSVDLVKGDASLADGDGITGPFRSARFTWGTPAAGPLAADLGPSVALVEGTATKGAETRRFSFAADTADVADAANLPRVEGAAFAPEPTNVEGDGTITVRIAPAVWLAQVDFADVPVSTDGKPVAPPKTTLAFRAFARGIKDGSAWVFSFAAAPRAPSK
jgi:hypothetical protein